MDRISNGEYVPKRMLEVFTGKASSGAGLVTCNLKYTPKDKDHIIIPLVRSIGPARWRVPHIVTLTGNTITISFKKFVYDLADPTTDGANSGGAGADPHTHGLTYSTTEVLDTTAANENLGPIKVYYGMT